MSEGLSKANHNTIPFPVITVTNPTRAFFPLLYFILPLSFPLILSSCLKDQGIISIVVMNRLDPIEELYDMYSEEEDTPRIVELIDDGLDFLSDVDGPADPYMDL